MIAPCGAAQPVPDDLLRGDRVLTAQSSCHDISSSGGPLQLKISDTMQVRVRQWRSTAGGVTAASINNAFLQKAAGS